MTGQRSTDHPRSRGEHGYVVLSADREGSRCVDEGELARAGSPGPGLFHETAQLRADGGRIDALDHGQGGLGDLAGVVEAASTGQGCRLPNRKAGRA